MFKQKVSEFYSFRKMDFSKLTPDELDSFLQMYGVIPLSNPSNEALLLFNDLVTRFGSQAQFSEPIVDLYIATQLKNSVQVPLCYNVDALDSTDFIKLARILNLPPEDSPSIRNRARRIIRILTSDLTLPSNGVNGLSNFNLLPPEIIVLLALNLPLRYIASLCQTNIRFNDIICNNDAYACFGN
jgi:hypothetical protein